MPLSFRLLLMAWAAWSVCRRWQRPRASVRIVEVGRRLRRKGAAASSIYGSKAANGVRVEAVDVACLRAVGAAGTPARVEAMERSGDGAAVRARRPREIA